MKIVSYNVNGIRAAMRKGLDEWIKHENPDIFCLQEVKALQEQVPEIIELFRGMGYEVYWHAAEKKGYSGVATFTKHKPVEVSYGIGDDKYDVEGRLLKLKFEEFSLINSYFPSGTSGTARQDYKYEYLTDFDKYIEELKKTESELVICGDVNICHTEIDIHNPKGNKNSSGFLP